MKVKAAPGLKVPREGRPREYITDQIEDVPASAYYRRLVADGSLLNMDTNPARVAEVSAAKGGKG